MKIKKKIIKCIVKNYKESEINYDEAKELLDYINNNTAIKVEEEIAVIGMSAQYPKAEDVNTYWNNILNGIDSVEEVPTEYLNKAKNYSPNKELNKAYCKWAGILNKKAAFDPLFFNISPKEAASMNPQQRLVLQEGWKAIEDAGYNPKSFSDENVGVYIGAEPSNYVYKSFTGASDAIVSSRLSYYLNLKGPSMVINTACSSSAVAIHIACESIRSGQVSMALAGGVFAELDEEKLIALSQIEMLSHSGKCYTFDERADGTVLSEGIGLILLKPLSKAIADKDHIYGIVKASGINQDGTSNGITAPNGISQEHLITDIYKKYNINPEKVSYIEAHGTGTKLGDPIEINALNRAFNTFTRKENYCAIGSSKTNIGHTGAAAGVAGVIKVLKAMESKKIPAILNYNNLNKGIDMERSPFYINDNLKTWDNINSEPVLAGINAFGHSGTNAHIVLEEYVDKHKVINNKEYYIIPISASTEISLDQYIIKLKDFLIKNEETISPNQLAYTLQLGRCHMTKRTVFIVRNIKELVLKLQEFLNKDYDSINSLKMTEDNRIKELLNKWLNGEEIEWNIQFKNNELSRISIPTYSFEENYYWKDKKYSVVSNNKKDSLKCKFNKNVIKIISDVLNIPEKEIDKDTCFSDYGIDETGYSIITDKLENIYGYSISIGDVIENNTVRALTNWLDKSNINVKTIPLVSESETQLIIEAEKLIGKMIISTLIEKGYLNYDSKLTYTDKINELSVTNKRWLKETINILKHRNEIYENGHNSYEFVGGYIEKDNLWNTYNSKKEEWFNIELIKAQLILAENMLNSLGDILQGNKLSTDIMFPDSSLEKVKDVYSGNKVVDYFNSVVADNALKYISELLEKDPRAQISIIEIGAGTGSTTEKVLETIDLYRNNIKEYCYTDISNAFLSYGRKQYGINHPYMSFRILDIEKDIRNQDIELQTYNIIIATNVLHATRSIKNTLSNAKNLLQKDGIIIINDMTEVSMFTHLSFGLLDGWWLFEDADIRIPGTPALKDKTWEEQLSNLNYKDIQFPILENHYLGQQIILGKSNGELLEIMTSASSSSIKSNKTIKKDLVINNSNLYIRDNIVKNLCASLELDESVLDYDKEFSFYGLDSILAVNLITEISKDLNVKLETPILFDYSTVNDLYKYLVTVVGENNNEIIANEYISPAIEVNEVNNYNKDIAIIGLSGRFGSCDNIEEFWKVISNGEEIIEDATRWDSDKLSGGNDNYCSKGSFINDIDKFDASFFNISGVEATYMDPQQRLLLEESWNALENSGYVGSNLDNERCGIYIGCVGGDYQKLVEKVDNVPAQSFWGNLGSMIPARISYYLNLNGPAISVDTACSSSLTAIYLACEALWSNKVSMAVAGGVYVQTTPFLYESANRAGMLSPTGKCYAFDDRADGFVPGEGVGVIVLKDLKSAIKDGDQIHGVIKGAAINQDGKSNGITAPNGVAQEKLAESLYAEFNINPREIQLLEAHGTGTKLGDPIEFAAASRAFKHYSDDNNYCAITSVKSNIGHTQTAAGIAGVIKSVIALDKKIIPPVINVNKVNSHIDIDNSPFYINTSMKEWEGNKDYKRKAAISSFGVSGTNAHLVIEEAPILRKSNKKQSGYLIALSAKRFEDLDLVVNNFVGYLENNKVVSVGDISNTLIVGRKHFKYRLSFISDNIEEVINLLSKWLKNKDNSKIKYSVIDNNKNQLAPIKQLGNDCIDKIINCTDNNEYLELLGTICDLYIQGYDLNYNNIFLNTDCRKISLPTYPLTKKVYWVNTSNKSETAEIISDHKEVKIISSKGMKLKNYLTNIDLYEDDSWINDYKLTQDLNLQLEEITSYLVLKMFLKTGIITKDSTSIEINKLTVNLGIKNEYKKLFMELTNILEQAKFITIENSELIIFNKYVYSEEVQGRCTNLEEEITRFLNMNPDYKRIIEIMCKFTDKYLEILSGDINYLDVVSAEEFNVTISKILKNNEKLNNLINDIVEKYVELSIQSNKKIRILHIDNQQEELDSSFLDILIKNKDNIEYIYSTNSVNSLKKVKNSVDEKYIDKNNFKILNLDNLKWVKEIDEKSFDLVIAVKVLSSTENVQNTINSIKYMLKDEGILLLDEITKVQNFEKVILGLTPMWWNYNDENNRMKSSPMISASKWEELLLNSEFSNINIQGTFPIKSTKLNECIIYSENHSEVDKNFKDKVNIFIKDESSLDEDTNDNNELENTIIRIWKEVLDIDNVTIKENFIDLGGDSILMTQVISRIDKLYPYNLDLKDLFKVYTVKEMAVIVEENLIIRLNEMSETELNGLE